MDPRAESIQQEIDQTRASMTEKMGEIETTVQGTAANMRTSVEQTVDQTVEQVKSMVGQTMETVKEKMNLERLVNERPWTMLGASVIVGYMLGSIEGSNEPRYFYDAGRHYGSSYDYGRYSGSGRSYGREEHRHNGDWAHNQQYRYYDENEPRTTASSPSPASMSSMSSRQQSGFASNVTGQFREEIDTLKDAAVMTITRILRDTLHQNLPQLAEEFERARQDRSQSQQRSSSGDRGQESQHQDTSQEDYYSSTEGDIGAVTSSPPGSSANTPSERRQREREVGSASTIDPSL